MSYTHNIKILMAKVGMNQKTLAKASEMSENGLSDILNGNTDPKIGTLVKIAHALNKPLWLLFIETED